MLVKQLFLKEEDTYNNDKIVSIIREQCKPFLEECGGLVPWRGVSVHSPSESVKFLKDQEFGIGTVRKNRHPKDSHEVLHNVLNDYFNAKIGIPLRSTSLFVAGDPDTAYNYGVRFAVFPIGDFKYAWSDIIADATVAFQEQWIDEYSNDTYKFNKSFKKSWKIFAKKNGIDDELPTVDSFFEKINEEFFNDYLSKDILFEGVDGLWAKAIKFYLETVDPWKFNTGLREALVRGEHEIMIACDKYYLVKIDLFREIEKDIFKGI